MLPLEEHLGDATKVIDSIVDQSPEGLEVLRGASTYTYDGNWKVQAENGADGYHVTAVHWNYAATTARRTAGDSANKTKAMDAGKWGKVKGGFYSYDHGHLLLWQEWTNPEDRPLWDRRDELVEKYGEEMANFMINISRNLCLYPNVYIMDQFSSQIRHFRPISADQTEVTIYCIAPKGEIAGEPVQAHPPVRGLLQRHRHGHPGRPRGVPLLQQDLLGHLGPVERHDPRLHARDRGPGRAGPGAGHDQGHRLRRAHRGRGAVPHPARVLEGSHGQGSGARRSEPPRRTRPVTA